jgi:hypothetical protein
MDQEYMVLQLVGELNGILFSHTVTKVDVLRQYA